MDLSSRRYVDARYSVGADRQYDQTAAQARLRARRVRGYVAGLICVLAPASAATETYRIATYAAPLSREGPGLLLRDLQKGEDTQLAAIAAVIGQVGPDVLLLTDFDFDHDGLALLAFNQSLSDPFAYWQSLPSNAGTPTGLDMDQNGRSGEPRDAQGYGRFAGDGGLAVLSQVPLGAVTDFSDLLWRDLPEATLPQTSDGPFLPDDVLAVQRLSSTGHWIVPILPQGGTAFHLLAWSATPPVFDGPEDRNGLRNRDELRLWEHVIDGKLGTVPTWFVVAGNANLDPQKGEGDRAAMATFLSDQRLHDPLPAQDTVQWPRESGPGPLRVSYVLPSAAWTVVGAGVFRPNPNDPESELLGDDGLLAGLHHLVWVDITR